MASMALRRRLHHGDVDGRMNEHMDTSGSDSLSEPLLGNYSYDGSQSEEYSDRNQQDLLDERKKERLHWTFLFSQLIAQWAQWIANIVHGSRSILERLLPVPLFSQGRQDNGKLLNFLSPLQETLEMLIVLSLFLDYLRRLATTWFGGDCFRCVGVVFFLRLGLKDHHSFFRHMLDYLFWLQQLGALLIEERLRNLRHRLQVPFDSSHGDHQDALRKLWRLAYPNQEIPPLKSELWKEMGWQGPDPSTDFRGGGFISLENLIFFANNYPDSFQILLHKKEGKRAEWEYPFAVAGINISFMLVQMLDLQAGTPTSKAGTHFLELLAEDESAFDDLFCVAFRLMDALWLEKQASYMDFNDVLKSTRAQLEHELAAEDVSSVKNLPAYTMLYR